jgi:hypothetical protein
MAMTRICTLEALLTSLLAVALPVGAVASGHVRTIVTLDPAAGQLPQGVAVHKPGNVFMSLASSHSASARSGAAASTRSPRSLQATSSSAS